MINREAIFQDVKQYLCPQGRLRRLREGQMETVRGNIRSEWQRFAAKARLGHEFEQEDR